MVLKLSVDCEVDVGDLCDIILDGLEISKIRYRILKGIYFIFNCRYRHLYIV